MMKLINFITQKNIKMLIILKGFAERQHQTIEGI